MNIYEKDGKKYEVFCRCNQGDRSSDYTCINDGEFDASCSSCHHYYWYYPETPLPETNSVVDTVEVKRDLVTEGDAEEDEDSEEYKFTCDECGEGCNEVTSTEEGEVCASCLAEKFIKCSECGEWHYKEESSAYDGGYICESCCDNDYFTCERCGDIHPCDEQNTVNPNTRRNEEQWCDDCVSDYAYRCDDCNDHFSENQLAHNGNRTLCYSCGENYYTCEGCGDVIHQDNSCYSEEDDCTYCESCYHDSRNNKSSVIHDYGYKPYPRFHGKGLHLGIELEMECKDRGETAEALLEFSDDEDLFYFKSDGSLNNGIELVTHPCSLAYHREDFGWSDILKKAVYMGARSHDTSTCGIHVHLSRKFFTLSEITRFVAFVNVHGDHLKRLARRGACDYSRFKNKLDGTKRLVNQEERYEAVNLYNDSTLEVRIFKGTLKESTLMSCIEVCDAMARFVKTSNISSIIGKSEENWEQFIAYVQNNLKMYSYLVSYMQHKGMLPVLPPAPLVLLEDPPEEIKLEDTIFGTPEIVPEFPWEFAVEPNSGIYAA